MRSASPDRDELGASYDRAIDPPIPYPQPQLGSAAFVLRPFREDDFAAASALGREAGELGSVEPVPAPDGATMAAFLEECRVGGTLLLLVIADPESDAYLGEVMVAMDIDGVAELGVGIVPAARGRGLATDALRLLADWALTTLGLSRVQVLVAPGNRAALRLSVNAGFLVDGRLRDDIAADGSRRDLIVLSRLADIAAT